MDFTQVIGWIGVILSVSSSYPQVFRTLRLGKAAHISVWTYALIFLAVICYLIRAIKIGEPIFIASNTLNAVGLGLMLFLIIFYRYRNGKNSRRKR